MFVPYYIQVAETIRGRILADQYGQGDLNPSSEELEKDFNFSAVTMLFMGNVYISTENKPAILTRIYYRGNLCSYRATLQL